MVALFRYAHGNNKCIHLRVEEMNKAKVIKCDENYKPLEDAKPELMHITELMKIIKDNKQITLTKSNETKKNYIIEELVLDTSYLDRNNSDEYIYNCMLDNKVLRNTSKFSRDYEVICSKSNKVLKDAVVKGDEDIQMLRFLCICTLFYEIRTEQDEVVRNLIQEVILDTIQQIKDPTTKRILDFMVGFIRKNYKAEAKHLEIIMKYDYIGKKNSVYYESILDEMINCIGNISDGKCFDLEHKQMYTYQLYNKLASLKDINMSKTKLLDYWFMKESEDNIW